MITPDQFEINYDQFYKARNILSSIWQEKINNCQLIYFQQENQTKP